MLDAGLQNDRESIYVAKAATDGALIVDNDSKHPIEQYIWPVSSVFLDFFNEKARDVWSAGLAALYDDLPFDGLWLQRNEVSGLCNGDVSDTGAQCSSMKPATQVAAETQSIVKFL